MPTRLARYFDTHAERLGFELRVTRLGHIQRGGTPCAFDRLIATRLGAAAMELAGAGQHGMLLGMVGGTVAAICAAGRWPSGSKLDTELLALAEMLAR